MNTRCTGWCTADSYTPCTVTCLPSTAVLPTVESLPTRPRALPPTRALRRAGPLWLARPFKLKEYYMLLSPSRLCVCVAAARWATVRACVASWSRLPLTKVILHSVHTHKTDL